MPNHTLVNSIIQFLLDGLSSKDLWVAHDMLLQSVGFVNVCNAILQEEIEPFECEQAINNSLCGTESFQQAQEPISTSE